MTGFLEHYHVSAGQLINRVTNIKRSEVLPQAFVSAGVDLRLSAAQAEQLKVRFETVLEEFQSQQTEDGSGWQITLLMTPTDKPVL